MDGELIGTLAFALAAGVTTFFAPCSYALLPGYVGYYVAATGKETAPLEGAIVRGLAAAGGAIGAFSAFSAAAVIVGELLERALPSLEIGVGAALVALGAWVTYTGPGGVHVLLPERRSSVWGFGVFGAMYATASTACVLPVYLGVAFHSFTMPVIETVLVLGTYVGAFAVLMLVVPVTTAVSYNFGLDRFAAHDDTLVRVAGVVLVLAGFGQLYIAVG